MKKNKYYWEIGRNGYTPELNKDFKENKIPSYYIGKIYKYEARKIIEDYDLGTACSYILRSERKHKTAVDCIQKAINHLEFELEKIKNYNK
jgi:hypothetical protein